MIKQRGVEQLANIREVLIKSVNEFFSAMIVKWLAMFDENGLLALQKEKVNHELKDFHKLFTRSKQ